MPEQQDGDNATRKPEYDALSQAPVEPSGNQAPPRPISYKTATNDKKSAGDIAKEIKAGEKLIAAIGILTLIVNSAIGIIYWQQLQEMVGVSGQTDSLTRAYRRQEMDIATLAEETHDLAQSTKTIAGNGVIQAKASKSSAETAKDALHVSERAYIQIPTPIIDYGKKAITISFINRGHIPTGEVGIIIHEATLPKPDPVMDPSINEEPTEFHWSEETWDAIAQDGPVMITTPIEGFSGERFAAGNQMIVLAGYITYNNGFANTVPIKTPFCWVTNYHLILKSVNVDPCEPSKMIPRLEKLDGYPSAAHKKA